MADAMVTGRIPEQKKIEGVRILHDAGLSASQAINLMFDKVIAEQSANFLKERAGDPPTNADWKAAAQFVDSIPVKRATRFDTMTKKEIKEERLRARGLMS